MAFALSGLPPMTDLFFGRGTTGGFGIVLLLAATSCSVIVFFARDHHGENTWRRLIAPALAAVALTGIAVLAVLHYATLLGVPARSPAARILPACYAVAAVIGLAWGMALRARRPGVYEVIGLGAHSATGQAAPAASQAAS